MSPEQQIAKLEERVKNLEQVTNTSFIANIKRYVFSSLDVTDLPPIKLSNLSDVSGTDTASTGQVLKKTATTWQPGTDNTA